MDSLRVTTTPEDMAAYATYVVFKTPGSRFAHVGLGLGMTMWAVPIPAFLIVALSGSYFWACVFIGLTAVLMLTISRDIWKRSVARKTLAAARRNEAGLSGESNLSMDDAGISDAGSDILTRVGWQAIESITDVGNRVYIEIRGNRAFVLPKRESASDVERFAREARKALDAHREATSIERGSA
jgi:hypothetical protein